MQNPILEEENSLFSKYFRSKNCANDCHILFYHEVVIIGHLILDKGRSVIHYKSAKFHYGKCLKAFIDFLIDTYSTYIDIRKDKTLLLNTLQVKCETCNDIQITRNFHEGPLLKIEKQFDSGKSKLQILYTFFFFYVNILFSVQYTVLNVIDDKDLRRLGETLEEFFLYGLSKIRLDPIRQEFVRKFIDIYDDKFSQASIQTFKKRKPEVQLEVIVETLNVLHYGNTGYGVSSLGI